MLRYSVHTTLAQAPGERAQVPLCAHCGQNHPFEMPPTLVEAAIHGRLVIFAGAGISTESRVVGDATFADRIAAELEIDRTGMAFAALMTAYESRFGRRQLLERFRQRLDYIAGFPELWRVATRFHHALATAYFLDTIVTTNWDAYFEEVTLASPVVVPDDYAFWDIAGRKVFKIHGSVRNLGTVVATEDDYRRCYRRLRDGVIGSTLRHILATKEVVFIGYSFGDDDLNRILAFLRREMGDVLPRSYVVSPHGYRGTDIPDDRVIKTDGTFFIHRLKDAAVARGALVPDRQYEIVFRLQDRLSEAHRRTSRAYRKGKSPAAVHSMAYQDGMRHALERIIARIPTGYYSRPHGDHHIVQTYLHVVKGAVKKRNYWDAAYARGYIMGLLAMDLTPQEAERAPVYQVWGANHDVATFEDFKTLAEEPELHKGAAAQAEQLTKDLGDDVYPHHQAYLDAETYIRAAGVTDDIDGPYGTV